MLDPVEEAKFAELRDKCRELGVPSVPEVFIGLKVHDKNNILTFEDIQRGHSWTRNYYNLLALRMSSAPRDASPFGAGYINGKRFNGNVDINYWGSIVSYGLFVAAAAELRGGIVCGTSDAAFSAEQYDLGALIAQGTDAGQMSYQALVITKSYDAASKTLKVILTRILNNNSGSAIVIKETGLRTRYENSDYYYLVERSVLSPSVPVANGAQLTVTYEITMDFSAID